METRQVELFPIRTGGDERKVNTTNIVSTKAAGRDATDRKSKDTKEEQTRQFSAVS